MDQQTGALTLNTNNMSYDGYVIRVTTKAEVQGSRDTEEYTFFITISDGCRGLEIYPPEAIDIPPFEFELWVSRQYSFTYAELNPPDAKSQSWYNCGMLKYTLIDANLYLPIGDFAFQLVQSDPQALKFRGLVP